MAIMTIRTGIPVLDKVLPEGIPRSNLVVIAGEPGTAKSVMLENLAHNFLDLLKEPIIFVTLDQPVETTESEMKSFGWNIERFVKEGLVTFVDCFSFRMVSRRPLSYVEIARNPRDVASLTTTLFQLMDRMSMNGKGAVLIDSLTELLMLETEKMFFDEVLDGLKTWRARGPKERQVPFFVTYHLGIESLKEIEQSVSYVMDGIIDLRFVPEFFEKGLLKREVRVRKMRGVAHHTGWKRFDVGKHGISTAPTER